MATNEASDKLGQEAKASEISEPKKASGVVESGFLNSEGGVVSEPVVEKPSPTESQGPHGQESSPSLQDGREQEPRPLVEVTLGAKRVSSGADSSGEGDGARFINEASDPNATAAPQAPRDFLQVPEGPLKLESEAPRELGGEEEGSRGPEQADEKTASAEHRGARVGNEAAAYDTHGSRSSAKEVSLQGENRLRGGPSSEEDSQNYPFCSSLRPPAEPDRLTSGPNEDEHRVPADTREPPAATGVLRSCSQAGVARSTLRFAPHKGNNNSQLFESPRKRSSALPAETDASASASSLSSRHKRETQWDFCVAAAEKTVAEGHQFLSEEESKEAAAAAKAAAADSICQKLLKCLQQLQKQQQRMRAAKASRLRICASTVSSTKKGAYWQQGAPLLETLEFLLQQQQQSLEQLHAKLEEEEEPHAALQQQLLQQNKKLLCLRKEKQSLESRIRRKCKELAELDSLALAQDRLKRELQILTADQEALAAKLGGLNAEAEAAAEKLEQQQKKVSLLDQRQEMLQQMQQQAGISNEEVTSTLNELLAAAAAADADAARDSAATSRQHRNQQPA